MKIRIYQDDSPEWIVEVAKQDAEDVIEITDSEWSEFNAVEERYERFLSDFVQRAATERQKTMGEIGQLRARLSQLESRLGVAATPAPAPAAPAKPHDPKSETDWGMGVGSRERPMSATDFRDELEELRGRTTERRARRGR